MQFDFHNASVWVNTFTHIHGNCFMRDALPESIRGMPVASTLLDNGFFVMYILLLMFLLCPGAVYALPAHFVPRLNFAVLNFQ